MSPAKSSLRDQRTLLAVAVQFFVNGAMTSSFIARAPQIRDQIRTLDGWVEVAARTPMDGRVTVYNFDVEGFHTYFVGDSRVWAHNWCPGASLRGIGVKALKRVKPKGWRTVKVDSARGGNGSTRTAGRDCGTCVLMGKTRPTANGRGRPTGTFAGRTRRQYREAGSGRIIDFYDPFSRLKKA